LRTILTKDHLPLQKFANAAQSAEVVNVLEVVNVDAIPDAEMPPIWALPESPPIPIKEDRTTDLVTEATPLVEAEATTRTPESQPRSLKA
jgi:hypothetical protein